MHKSISKRLLAGLLSVVMVLSLFAAVPANNAQAAATVKINSYTSVKAGNTVNYTIKNLTKNQYAKVSVTGTAKEGITVKKGTTTVKSTTKINGTGKNIVLKVKNYGVPGKKYALTVKVYNKKTNKLVKTVNTKTASIYKLTTTVAITPNKVDEMEVGGTVVLTATKAPANSTQAITWSTSDKAVATVDGGIVTAVAAGTATITATSGKKSASVVINVKAEEKPDEPEVNNGELPEITSVKATKVDTIEVTFASAVTAEVAFTVTRGTTNVTFATPVWNADKTVATLVTDAKMVAGKHVVTAKSAVLEKEVTGEVTIESQKVAEIVIKNTTALTNPGKTEAYVYYDVLDQYGESIKNTTSITWTVSTNAPVVKDTAIGKLTIKKTGAPNTFTYNEQIYITGVYEKTGVTVNTVVTVGMEQSLDRVEVAGFIKKDTTTLVESLPANFKSGDYVLAYTGLDQNGNVFDLSAPADRATITFISENVLVIKQDFTDAGVKTIDGIEYACVDIKPGDKVSDGGEVSIKAIATKTGTTTTFFVTVGEDVKLTSFTMSQPSGIVAEGEWVEIPFTALDQNGNEIKSFANIAKAKTYNELTLSSSETIQLVSDDEGNAVLEFFATNTGKIDGIDLPVVVNAIVTMGEGSSLSLYVSDPAVPVGIYGVAHDEYGSPLFNSVYAETDAFKFDARSLAYVDQYGRKMVYYADVNYKQSTKRNVADYFFTGATMGTGHTTDYNDYKFYVKAEYIGTGKVEYTTDNGASYTALTSGDYFLMTAGNSNLYKKNGTQVGTWDGSTTNSYLASSDDIINVLSGENFKFSIVKTKNDTDFEGVSTTKNFEFKFADVSKLTGLFVDSYGTVKLTTPHSSEATCNETDGIMLLTKVSVTGANEYAVYGYCGDVAVYVPANQVSVRGNFLKDSNSDGALELATSSATGSAFKWSDLYDYTSAKNVRKTASDRLVVTVKNVISGAGTDTTLWTTTETTNIKISDAASYAATIVTVANDCKPNNTVLNIGDILAVCIAKDQYGLTFGDVTWGYTIKNIVENPDGITEANFKVSRNGNNNPRVDGAELGDKFDLEIVAYTNGVATAEKKLSFTVGSDALAKITTLRNNYREDLLVTLSLQ